jgi:hypothetical protein
MLGDPMVIFGIILGATILGGLLMWWTTRPKGK